MNSFVVYEALAVGFKEGFKIGIVWLVFHSYLAVREKKIFLRPFAAGLFSALLLSFSVLLLPQGLVPKEYIGNFISMSFALFLILSVGALIDASGVKLFEPFQRLTIFMQNFKKSPHPPFSKGGQRGIIVFFSTLLFFSPDIAGTFLFLKELAIMKEQDFMPYVSAMAGFLLALTPFFILFKYFKPYRVGSFLDLPQLLLFLAIVKLLGGGIKGFAEISLIPSVQRGLMKFSHDFVHQVVVLLMVPDHPLLKTTVWNFIGILFSQTIASLESLLILLFFPLVFLYYSLFRPLPEPHAHSGAERRKIKYLLLSDRRRKALPVIFFISIILIAWFLQRGEPISRLYNPKPKPVVEDKGIVMIPLNDPTTDLRDGALHKFALTYQGDAIRIMIIKRSDNVLSVSLDACEICPPEGYGQRGEYVICIYCNTPIPINTLGEPGGCNPIPLFASVDNKYVRIELKEILKKWEYVKSGKSKEGIK